jgi:hypothetical protein
MGARGWEIGEGACLLGQVGRRLGFGFFFLFFFLLFLISKYIFKYSKIYNN